MKDLEQKYINDQLHPEELRLFRTKINSLSDDEIGAIMKDSWMNDEIDTSGVTTKRMDNLKISIDERVRLKRFSYNWGIKIIRIAASILLPLFMFATLYLYNENQLLGREEIQISTGKGERTNLTLPDGTIVTLNSDSKLSYMPAIYNKGERQINFEGEGYFQVYKDKDCPFIIKAEGLNVKVLGTVFNLLVRNEDKIAELSLEEGSVQLSSALTGEGVVLKPEQKAVLNQVNGRITVLTEENIGLSSAWKHGNLIFRNTPLGYVLKTIQERYDVEFKLECSNDCLNDLFTGTVTTSDLNGVLEILEKSYHMKASIKGKFIYMREIE